MLVLAPISMAALFRNSAAPSNIGLLSRMVPTWPALVIGGRGASGKIDRQPYASHRNGPQASKISASLSCRRSQSRHHRRIRQSASLHLKSASNPKKLALRVRAMGTALSAYTSL
jgi:hypothetical protein